MKLGIVGKGGVGKTTVSALLAQTLADGGRRVVAVDTDSNPNLGMSLGFTLEQTEAVPLLPRALAVGGTNGVSADQIISEYGRMTPAGVTLLSGIRVSEAGAGCTCAGHATVRSLLGDALDAGSDVTLVDMEAGLEHLSRSGGTLAYADILLVVVEPSRKSIITAARTLPLAEELGIAHTYALGNKARLPEDETFFKEQCEQFGVPLAGIIPYEPDVVMSDRTGVCLTPEAAPAVRVAVTELVTLLDRVMASATGSTPPDHPLGTSR
ncbi:MAG: carbon monoxide dehydrogenase accessory protein CooC [Acidimicrobiales bacterium]